MKKIIIVLLILIFIITKINKPKETQIIKEEKETRGVFISYIEISKYINEDIEKSKKNIDKIIKNIKNLNLNQIILQVRSNTDAIYESNYFPWSLNITNEEGKYPGFDILNYFIEKSHNNNIELLAWINPYRIRTTSNIDSITEKSPAYKYLNTDYISVENGIYFNPSKQEVEDLIVNGVEEILKNYNVDGILFDDYFYSSESIDIKDYENYIQEKYLDLKDYHLYIINKMIERVHNICKEYNTPFGISPNGNIDSNYDKICADVKEWTSSNKYLDFIMPQIYYGFYNSNKDYYSTIKEWSNLIKVDSIKLYIALAFYKVGQYDEYAKEGCDEWINNTDIIMREILLTRYINKCQGFSLFRYDSLFNNDNKIALSEINNLKKILN